MEVVVEESYTKKCLKCGMIKVGDHFNKKAESQDGLAAQCSECTKEYGRKWRAENPDKYYLQKRIWIDKNREKRRVIDRNWQAKNRVKIAAKSKRWRVQNKVKVSAYGAFRRAIKKGIIIKEPCAICGVTDGVHGHHEDYSKPLEVKWLCSIHHKALERRKDITP